MKRVIFPCETPRGTWQRHRWEVVAGIHSTPEHPYTERRCKRCQMYEGNVR
jgi:hypothetical protein